MSLSAIERIAVGIVEDDAQIREGFAFLISRSPDLGLAGVWGSAEEVLGSVVPLPEVVLMDVQLPGMDGIECISELKGRSPGTQFMMLTVFEDDEVIFRALEAGASGYLLKTAPAERVLAAIRELHEGGAPMSAQIARRVIERFRVPKRNTALVVGDCNSSLTAREGEVLGLLAQGFLYKEIADKLSISIETVRKHLGRIYKKLHVNSRTEAVLKFLGH